MNIPRKPTRPVQVGPFIIGSEQPIRIQTMWKRPLKKEDPQRIVAGISRLEGLGCHILRFAVPDGESADILKQIASRVSLPLVADIHFDYTLALSCIDSAIAKIRINPGNIGAQWKAKEVLKKAKDRGKAIRIGINGGSLPRTLRGEEDTGSAMLRAAEEEIDLLEACGFDQAVFSLKSSDIEDTLRANILFSESYDYPLHLGITEAGPLVPGTVKNSIGISRMLERGIGDTIRVSLSDSMENEIIAGRAILSAENISVGGVEIVSCPTCGRKSFDVVAFMGRIREYLYSTGKTCTIAVMGCEVNGPEEAKHADIGITGAGNSVILFRNGKVLRKINSEEAFEALKEEIDRL